MVSKQGGTPVPLLRTALKAEVEATSLRTVARQAGMGVAGVLKFLGGGQPAPATRRKLERWYVLHGPARRLSGALDADAALSVVRVLVQDIPAGKQRPVAEALVRSLGDAYRLGRMAEPAWLARLREQVEGGGAGG